MMLIRRCKCKYAILRKKEGFYMEMIKKDTNKNEVNYAKTVDVIKAMRKCTKKYKKALTNLAK